MGPTPDPRPPTMTLEPQTLNRKPCSLADQLRVQLAEVRPSSVVAREHVATAAIALTTALFLLISLSSYAVFGPGSQSGARLGVSSSGCWWLLVFALPRLPRTPGLRGFGLGSVGLAPAGSTHPGSTHSPDARLLCRAQLTGAAH